MESIVSGNVNVKKTVIHEVVTALTDAIKKELEEGNEVCIKNLVSFKQVVFAPIERYSPFTGENIHLPERKKVKARVSPKLQVK